ncbi:MAG: hypothetical protein NTAFB01_38520 [Nitrospira sp.]
MKTRMSAMICLLCVLGYSDLTRADDPSVPRVADPYALAISPDPPTMSSGTPELYLSFMAGVALPRSTDATFTDGSQPTVMPNVDYQMKQSIGGNAGIWFPTRNKLWGFDLGLEITGYVFYPDVAWGRDNFNGVHNPDGSFKGTTTEGQSIYVGPNFLIRYPMAISETYPNGRWFPYVGIGVGAHQIAQRPGASGGVTLNNAITDSRNTTIGFQGVGGIKGHLFKYVAVFAEAKYLHAHHNGLSTDRFGQSDFFHQQLGGPGPIVNAYSSNMDTILVHVGLSLHFDVRP